MLVFGCPLILSTFPVSGRAEFGVESAVQDASVAQPLRNSHEWEFASGSQTWGGCVQGWAEGENCAPYHHFAPGLHHSLDITHFPARSRLGKPAGAHQHR